MAHIFSAERASPGASRIQGDGERKHPATAYESRLAALQRLADQSPATQRLTQMRGLESKHAVQRVSPEEEDLVQGQFISEGAALQRQDDEEMLQGKAIDSGGLPAQLRESMQAMSGVDLGGVRVHYNSSAPAQVGAHAFAQGSDIHLASGQERHLPHEAWHVVQQKQGRVQPTMELGGVAINDSPALESEADRMGERASR